MSSEIGPSYAGPLDFDVSFHPQEKSTKTMAWIYSQTRDKLYVTMGMNCPINFHTSICPPAGTNIVVTSTYIKATHSLTPVQRCLTHQNPSEPYNLDHPALDHLIRCESHEGVYSTDDRTGQKLLTLPYTKPDVGSDYSTYIFKFMCWSSCVGGMNRRRMKVVCRLQYQEKCIGHRSFEVRVCACPGRDCNGEDKQDKLLVKVLKKEKESDGETSDTCNSYEVVEPVVKLGFPTFKEFVASPPPSKRSKHNDADAEYWLSYNSYEEYEFMRAVRAAYRATHQS